MSPRSKPNDGKKVALDVAQMKSVLIEQMDFLVPVVQEDLQAILEAEMEECLLAIKHERRAKCLGYRSEY